MVAQNPTEASCNTNTLIPLTAARWVYRAHASFSSVIHPDYLEDLRRKADEADAAITSYGSPATWDDIATDMWKSGTATVENMSELREIADVELAVDTSTAAAPKPPATAAEWRPFLPADAGFAPVAITGACTCPGSGRAGVPELVTHVTGCQQNLHGQAQPFGETFCSEFNLTPNVPVAATAFGAALRGITEAGLADAMTWEAEDEVLDAASAAVDAREAVGPLLDELSTRITAREYDQLLDGLDLDDVVAVRDYLRERLAAADTTSRPAYPGEVEELHVIEAHAAMMRAKGNHAAADALDQSLERLRALPKHRMRVTTPAVSAPSPKSGGIPADILQYQRYDWIWTKLAVLRQIKAQADHLRMSPWQLLGSYMGHTAAAIPGHVRLVPENGEPGADTVGANVSEVIALVGPPGQGKSTALNQAAGAVPLTCEVKTSGTGEGFNSVLAKQLADGNPLPALLIREAEAGAIGAEMVRLGNTLTAVIRQHWGGDLSGKTTGDKDRRTGIDTLWARLVLLVGLQPHWCVQILAEVSDGTPQRFLWMPCWKWRRAKQGDVPAVVIRLPRWGHELPDGAPPAIDSVRERPEVFWVRQPPAMAKMLAATDEETWVSPTAMPTEADQEASLRVHDVLHQFKVATIIAAMDGKTQPQDVHWKVAAAVMAVSRLCVDGLTAHVESLKAAKRRDKGQELADVAAARDDHMSNRELSDQMRAETLIVIALGKQPMTKTELRAVVCTDRATRRGFNPALAYLIRETKTVIDDGYGQPLRLATHAG